MARQALKAVSKLIDLANKEFVPADSFLMELKRSIEITDEKGWGLPSKTFKPSSMNCMRNSYYQIIGEEPDKGKSSYNMVGICNSGSDIHNRIQTAVSNMKENGFDCEYLDVGDYIESQQKKGKLKDIIVREKLGNETKLYNETYNISFMCDGLIKYHGKLYILEIKTEISSKWYSRDGVDPKHCNQARAYTLSLRLDDVIFLYISRDNLDMKSYMYHVTTDMRQELVDYIKETNKYIDMKIAPPKINNKRICQYCIYKQACEKEK